MRLPGTRYQEHGWEQVRKLLGHCSLQVFARAGEALLPAQADAALALYTDLMAETLSASARSARAEASGNSYGESVFELALSLLYELQARPADWVALCQVLAGEPSWRGTGAEALLRKKINDLYALLRDKVDADNYQAACGRPCSPNRMYAYRMLDTAYGDIARLFADWQTHRAQVGAILGRPLDAMPIEVRQMRSAAQCKGEWVLRWSASQAAFGAGPGPLHTRSKRFASLKEQPDKIAAMLAEIADYEELSANRDQEWASDANEATVWMDDLWRVLEQAPGAGPDQIQAAVADPLDDPTPEPDLDALPDADPEPAELLRESAAAAALSLPPSFMQLARAVQDAGSWTARLLHGQSLAVRLAVYLKMLGSADDSYPAEWRDPATGELPTMAQLAVLDGVSLPTLRKRRDGAIAELTAAAARSLPPLNATSMRPQAQKEAM
ncbi:hypothetical protein [Massilia sp. CF038]|uniref:hypothetical protein n=1 Tax=Massilia sp. CF038 TaxID=1881045 RepID=UPI00090F12FA|nr:hypothetical protein [Massilia sp. CF038]SHG99149.1 hypothetical protein SAMN05428948_2217 [Massilia sp. CF038]